MVKVNEHKQEIKNIREQLKGNLSEKRRYDLGRRLIKLEKELKIYEQLQKA